MMLRAAQTRRFLGGKQFEARSVGEDQFAERAVPSFDAFVWDAGEQSAFTFDACVARVGCGRCNDGNANAVIPHRVIGNILGAGTRLTESTACQDQPNAPITRRCYLVAAG